MDGEVQRLCMMRSATGKRFWRAPDVHVGERGVEHFEVCVVYVLEDERRGLALGVPDDVEQFDDVRAAAEVLQDFDLAPEGVGVRAERWADRGDEVSWSCGRAYEMAGRT